MSSRGVGIKLEEKKEKGGHDKKKEKKIYAFSFSNECVNVPSFLSRVTR